MELILNKGLDNILFGIKPAEAMNILGKPDKMFTDPEEPNEFVYQYNQQKLMLTFYQDENDRLGYIRSANPEITFKGKKIVHLPIAKVREDVFAGITQHWETENYDFFDTYFNEEFWLTLNVEYDEITDIEIGVPIGPGDQYEWPG